MRISITGTAGLARDQIRAYAEYRVFAALARFGRLIRTVSVNLEPERPWENDRVRCAIVVDLNAGEPVRSRWTARHVIDSIDQAAGRARRALERRAKQETVCKSAAQDDTRPEAFGRS